MHLSSKAVALLALIALALLGGCRPRLTKEQRALRNEIRRDLAEQAYDKALPLARRAVEETPHHEDGWESLVQTYFGLRDLAGVRRAIAAWRVGVEKPSPKLDEYAGDLALAENDPAAAVQFWQKARHTWHKEPRLLEKIARAEEQQQHWGEADKQWSGLLALRDSGATRANRALCRRRMHRWDDALADVRTAQQLAPDDPEVARATKLFNRISKFLTDMRELDARLILAPKDAGLLTDRALFSLRAEDPELAIDDLDAAAALDPRAVRPKLFKAVALVELGRADECEKLAVEKFIRLDTLRPELLETLSRLDAEISVERNSPELYVTRAWELNDIAQPRLALADAEQAAQIDPSSGGAWAEAAYALMKIGRAEEAFERVKHATEVDPNFSTGWQYRGEMEMFRGDFVAAVDSLSRAITINQTTAALQKREECYRRLGLFVKAEQDHRAWNDLNAREAK